MYLHDPLVDLPRPSAEDPLVDHVHNSKNRKFSPLYGRLLDPKVDSPRTSAETPRVDLPRRGAEDPLVDHVHNSKNSGPFGLKYFLNLPS